MVLLLAIFFAGSLTTSSIAQEIPDNKKRIIHSMPCDSRANMYALIAKYREGMLFWGTGLINEFTTGQWYEGNTQVFVNQETGNFTIIVNWPDGISCLLMNGKQFTPYAGLNPWEITPKKEEDL